MMLQKLFNAAKTIIQILQWTSTISAFCWICRAILKTGIDQGVWARNIYNFDEFAATKTQKVQPLALDVQLRKTMAILDFRINPVERFFHHMGIDCTCKSLNHARVCISLHLPLTNTASRLLGDWFASGKGSIISLVQIHANKFWNHRQNPAIDPRL